MNLTLSVNENVVKRARAAARSTGKSLNQLIRERLEEPGDHDRPERQARALEIFAEHRKAGSGVLSTQVLQEYFAVATRKLGVPAEIAKRKVELVARMHIVDSFSG